jgi:hypothetical protein
MNQSYIENLNQCLLNATNTWFLFLLKIAPYTKKISSNCFEDMNNEEDFDGKLNDIPSTKDVKLTGNKSLLNEVIG